MCDAIACGVKCGNVARRNEIGPPPPFEPFQLAWNNQASKTSEKYAIAFVSFRVIGHRIAAQIPAEPIWLSGTAGNEPRIAIKDPLPALAASKSGIANK